MLAGFKRMAAVLGFAMACAGAAEKDYPIRLHRPDKPGYKYDLATVVAAKSEIIRKTGERVDKEQEQVVGVELRGTVEVAAVDETGIPTKMVVTIEKLASRMNDQEQEQLPKGKVVTIDAGDSDAKFTLQGGELTEAQKWVLGVAIDMTKRHGTTIDDYYGTKQRQKFGASWPINGQVLAEMTKKAGGSIDKKDIHGTLKLLGVEPSDGVDCLRISGELKMDNVTWPRPMKAPDGMRPVRNGSVSSFMVLIPVDLASRYLSESSTNEYTMVFEGQQRGKTTTAEYRQTRVRNIRAIPLDD